LIERAKELQPEACEIVRRCFNNDEYRVFWNDTNIFTRHFREAGEQQGSQHYRPQAPTVTPQQYQQALEVGVQQSGSASDWRTVSPNVWVQQGLFPTGQQSQMPNTTPNNSLDFASTANISMHPAATLDGHSLGFDDSRSTHGVHESAQQWYGNQQIAHLPSRDPNWAPNAALQRTLSSGVGDPTTNDYRWDNFAFNLWQDYD
jgi:hypothetical protein